MAVKIFCNACQKFIRDAVKNDLKSLDGSEICEDCLNFTKAKIDEIKKTANRGIQSINFARDKALTELDRSIRKVIRANDPE